MPITKTQRLLDLIAFLAGRRHPASIEQVMSGVPAYAERWVDGTDRARASVRRTFERDKDELRGLGIPIEPEPLPGQNSKEPAQGYRLARHDLYLPYIRLLGDSEKNRVRGDARHQTRLSGMGEPFEIAEHEVAVAIEGLFHLADLPGSPLAEDARSAYRKLTFDLDPRGFRLPPIAFCPTPDGADVKGRLRLLFDARTRRKRVTFRYRGIRRNAETDRDVAPYGLLYQRGTWYLIGEDASRNAVRTFRVSRMERIEVNAASPKTSDFGMPPDFDLKTFAGREAWELGGPEDRWKAVRVLFRHPTSLWVERNALGTLVEQRSGGVTVRDFEVRDPEPFVRWILSFEGRAEILLPADMGRDLRRTAMRVAEVHRETARA